MEWTVVWGRKIQNIKASGDISLHQKLTTYIYQWTASGEL
jgi:hypothetical protein